MKTRVLVCVARAALVYLLGVAASLALALVASQAARFPGSLPALWYAARGQDRFYLDVHRTWGADRTVWTFYSTREAVPTRHEPLVAARQRTHEIFYRMQEQLGYRPAEEGVEAVTARLPAGDPLPNEWGAVDAYG